MNDNTRFTICFIFIVLCISFLIFSIISSINTYESKIKTVERRVYTIKLENGQSLFLSEDVKNPDESNK